jgi:hypothetical protein
MRVWSTILIVEAGNVALKVSDSHRRREEGRKLPSVIDVEATHLYSSAFLVLPKRGGENSGEFWKVKNSLRVFSSNSSNLNP